MKTQKILAALLCLALVGMTISCKKEKKEQDATDPTTLEEAGYEYVDLGLSVMWATTNIGAESPREKGCYYQWGSSNVRDDYGWATYQHCGGTSTTLTKYNSDAAKGQDGYTDTNTQLLSADDPAHVLWGGKWVTPTKDNWLELLEKCTWEYTLDEGTKGYKVTRNGKSIFLPITGIKVGTDYKYYENDEDEVQGNYWSSSLYTNDCTQAYGLYFFKKESNGAGNLGTGATSRSKGAVVRPVFKK